MTQHTEGPWEWKETPNGIEICANGGWLFLLDDGRTPKDAGSDFIATQKANLNLMVAAPELLAALRFYVAICGNTGYSITRETAKELYDNAQAIIKKATGGL